MVASRALRTPVRHVGCNLSTGSSAGFGKKEEPSPHRVKLCLGLLLVSACLVSLTSGYFGTFLVGTVATTVVPLSVERISSLPPRCWSRSLIPRSPTPNWPLPPSLPCSSTPG